MCAQHVWLFASPVQSFVSPAPGTHQSILRDAGNTVPERRHRPRAILDRASEQTAAVEALEPRQLLSAGLLDPTFGVGGETTDPALLSGDRVAVQSDGRIVVLGSAAGSVQLSRYHVNGTLDPTFGTGGRAATAFP